MKKLSMWIVCALCIAVFTGCQKSPSDAPQSPSEMPNSETAASSTAVPESSGAERVVEPLPCTIDLSALNDRTFAASFSSSDVAPNADGTLCITMTVYDCDLFDALEVSQLAAGDTIVVEGESIVINSIENANNLVTINGGIEEGGCDLYTEEDGVYYPIAMDVGPIYHSLGEVTLPIGSDFVFTDSSDLDNPEKQYSAEEFKAEMESGSKDFSQQATKVRTEGGEIAELTQIYMP